MARKIHVVVNPHLASPADFEHAEQRLSPAWDRLGCLYYERKRRCGAPGRRAAASGVDVVQPMARMHSDGSGARPVWLATPLAILPGGTANLMSVELGVPKNLAQAAAIAATRTAACAWWTPAFRRPNPFPAARRPGLRRSQGGDRRPDLKDRYGVMAYSIGALKALTDTAPAHYRLTLDARAMKPRALAAWWTTPATSLCRAGLKSILVDDGLLDVIIVRIRASVMDCSRRRLAEPGSTRSISSLASA